MAREDSIPMLYNKLLLEVATNLTDEFDDMKFLCRDDVPKGKLKSCTKPQELFGLLEEARKIRQSDLSYLKKLLKECKRTDIIEDKIEPYEQEYRSRQLVIVKKDDFNSMPSFIGTGRFGTVYRVEHKEWGLTILKTYGEDSTGNIQQHQDKLLSEVQKISSVKSPHVVKVFGVMFEHCSFSITMDYMEYQSLDHFYQRINYKPLPMNLVMMMVFEVVLGMADLHEAEIIHRNLKINNIMIDMAFHAKVSDYGLKNWENVSRTIGHYKRTKSSQSRDQAVCYKLAHMAPEMMLNEMSHNKESDIYSFSIALWEILTGNKNIKPYEEFSSLGSEEFSEAIINGGKRPSLDIIPNDSGDNNCLQFLKEMMKECWSKNPSDRPHFKVLAVRMKAENEKFCKPADCLKSIREVDSILKQKQDTDQTTESMAHCDITDDAVENPHSEATATGETFQPTVPPKNPPTTQRSHINPSDPSNRGTTQPTPSPLPPPTGRDNDDIGHPNQRTPPSDGDKFRGVMPEHDRPSTEQMATARQGQSGGGVRASSGGGDGRWTTGSDHVSKPEVLTSSPASLATDAQGVASGGRTDYRQPSSGGAMPPRDSRHPQQGQQTQYSQGQPPPWSPGYPHIPMPNMQQPGHPGQPGLQTLTHHHSGGAKTTIVNFNAEHTKGVQIGDHNVMNIGGGGSGGRYHSRRVDYSSSQSSRSSSHKITQSTRPVTNDDVEEISGHLGNVYRQLGRQVGFSDGQLDGFEHDFPPLREHNFQMLRTWFQSKSPQLVDLAQILCKVGKSDVAAMLND